MLTYAAFEANVEMQGLGMWQWLGNGGGMGKGVNFPSMLGLLLNTECCRGGYVEVPLPILNQY